MFSRLIIKCNIKILTAPKIAQPSRQWSSPAVGASSSAGLNESTTPSRALIPLQGWQQCSQSEACSIFWEACKHRAKYMSSRRTPLTAWLYILWFFFRTSRYCCLALLRRSCSVLEAEPTGDIRTDATSSSVLAEGGHAHTQTHKHTHKATFCCLLM